MTASPARYRTFRTPVGPFALIESAMANGVELAVDDINQAGGVWGDDVRLVTSDSRDRDTAQVLSEADRLVSESVDAIVGPATSSDTATLLDDATTEGVVLVSPSATGARLGELDVDGRFFRTAPAEQNMTNAAAAYLREQGVDRLAILRIDDPYGVEVSSRLQLRFAQLGGVVTTEAVYAIDESDLADAIDDAAGSGSDAILIIGLGETDRVLAGLADRGVGPSRDGTLLLGVDANALGLAPGPGLDGYQAITPQVDLRPLSRFTDRLDAAGIDPSTGYWYAPEGYDATVIIALAAETTGSADIAQLGPAIIDVTRDGEKCFDFAECKRLLGEGADIDYDGLAGPHELNDDGDPRVSSYALYSYDATGARTETYLFSQ